VRKFTEGAEHLVEIEYAGRNQRGEVNVRGNATVRLPSHDVNDRFLFTSSAE
jgi:hypothetical protein